nr:MAG TPA: hypothetical protein [Caudoviricetes sp.]DAS43158.1 MAG TPA: hypothetical protein [Caudoviricetes sp.]
MLRKRSAWDSANKKPVVTLLTQKLFLVPNIFLFFILYHYLR